MRKSLLLTAALLGLAGGGAAVPSAQAQPARRTGPAPADAYENAGVVPPTSAYQGGAGVPLSPHASNIGPGTARSEIAPRLPNPDAPSNSPEALLRAAQRALSRGQTGAAQQALEMAETRILSRTTDPSMANQPDTAAMTQHIGAARRALGAGDRNGAQAEIQQALAAPVPPPGPAVTTTTVYPGQPGYVPPASPGYMPPASPGYMPPAAPGYMPPPSPGYGTAPMAPMPMAPAPRGY